MPYNISFSGSFEFEYNGAHVKVELDNSNNELKDFSFRTRRGGDRFTFPKRNVTKPLRKALNEQKIPSEMRDSLLVMCRGETVLWCEGLGYSQQGEALRKSNNLKVIISKRGDNNA